MDISKFIFISCKLFERIFQRSPNINFLKIFNYKVLYFKNSKKKKKLQRFLIRKITLCNYYNRIQFKYQERKNNNCICFLTYLVINIYFQVMKFYVSETVTGPKWDGTETSCFDCKDLRNFQNSMHNQFIYSQIKIMQCSHQPQSQCQAKFTVQDISS